MQLRIEVLPAPLGPIRARSSPARASNETSRSTSSPPKDRETPERPRSAIPPAAAAVLLDVAVAAAPAGAAEVELLDVLVRAQPLGRAVQHDAAVLEYVGMVGHLQRDLGVLLHEEYGGAELLAHRAQPLHEVTHHQRRE